MLTFQDFEKADDKPSFVLRAIGVHKNSDMFKTAKIADEYDAQRNTTITSVVRTIYDAHGVEVDDFTVSNSKIASNFFNRLNTQRCMYSLGNGVSFIDPYETSQDVSIDETKQKLGPHFDHILREAAYHALIHGKSYMFWNMDRVHEFKMTEFVDLLDENDGSLRAGIRFWQIDPAKPLNAVLYEEDGYTRYRTKSTGGGLEEVEPKRAYVTTYEYTDAGDVFYTNEQNYTRLPIVPVYASRIRQSTIVGMRDAIDAYDLIASGFANDLIDCAQIYWIVENYGGMDDAELAEFLDKLKFNHVANIDTSAGGAVKPYTQNIPSTARTQFLSEMRSRIYEDFGALDVHMVEAGATNDHIDAAYQPMDENAADFEHWISDAIEQLLKLQGIEDTPIFRRNKISNETQVAEMVVMEAPYIDRSTLLRKFPNLSPDEVQAMISSNRPTAEQEQMRNSLMVQAEFAMAQQAAQQAQSEQATEAEGQGEAE